MGNNSHGVLIAAMGLLTLPLSVDFMCIAVQTFTSTELRPIEAHLRAERVDVNRATVGALAAVPGISELTASALVTHRERWGPFCSSAALTAVSGIGEITARQLHPYLSFGRTQPVEIALNQLSSDELREFNGVGQVISGRIIDARARLGGFECMDQLVAVRGISWRLAEELWSAPPRRP